MVRGRGRARGGFSTNPFAQASFFAPLTSSIILAKGVGLPTFTRASTATFKDFEGVVRTANAGEPRFEGARRVENLAYDSENFQTANWTKYSATASGNTLTFSSPTSYMQMVARVVPVDRTYLVTVRARLISGSGYFKVVVIDASDGSPSFSAVSPALSVGDSVIVSVSGLFPSATFSGNLTCQILGNGTISSGAVLSLSVMIEDVTDQSVQTPAEYVSRGVLAAPYHGAGVDGVKCFETKLDGTPIPESTLKGLLVEQGSTNLFLNSAVGVTQTTPVLAVATHTLSFTGTGTIVGTGGFIGTLVGTGAKNRVSLTVTATAAAATLTVTGTCTNVQIEQLDIASSYIKTTTVAVARVYDYLTYPYAGNVNAAQGWFLSSITPLNIGTRPLLAYLMVDVSNGRSVYANNPSMATVVTDSVNSISNTTMNALVAENSVKRAGAWDAANKLRTTGDGKTITSSAAFNGGIYTGVTMGIGGAINSGNGQINGSIKNVYIGQNILTNAQLQKVTT